MELTLQNLTFLFFIIALWVAIGWYNYRQRMTIIDQYCELIEELNTDEKEGEDMYASARAFNYRENLINKYTPLEHIRTQMEENERKTKSRLLFSFLLLGPLYNIK